MDVILDADCSDYSEKLLNKMSELKLINGSRKLFLHGNQSSSILRNQNINLDSEVLILNENGLFQVKSVEQWRGSKLHITKIKNSMMRRKPFDLEGIALFIIFTVSKMIALK